MSDTTATPETTDTELTPNDRRALLRKIAIGGAGAAAGAVMLGNGRASAAPTTLQTETTTTAIAPTIIDYEGPAVTEGPSVFSAGPRVPATDADFPAGVGGYGDSTVAHGVHGSTTAADGFGVVAANLAPAAAAPTDPVPTGLAVASLGGAQMRFVQLPGAVTGPTPGDHLAGEMYVDKDGTLWFTVPAPTTTDATAVRFERLAGAGAPSAGSYHAISPQRVFDSRQPGYPAALRGQFAPNTNKVISVADGRNESGTVTLTNAVPAGATAVHINLTVANMTGPNFLQVTAGDVTTVTASALNWSATDIQIANALTVPVDAEREIRVYCGNQTGSTDVIVDVFGYYL